MSEAIDNRITKLPEWRELYEVAQTWEYNSIHSHAECAAIMKLQPLTIKYYTQIGRCRYELRRKARRCLVSERSIGYRIAKPNEHVGIADNEVDLAKDRIKKAVEIIEAAPEDKLSESELKTLVSFTNRMYRIYGPIAQERAQLKRIAAGKDPIDKDK